MRNMDERMAEISRRSEKIFEQRRQRRKHVLAACIPLALCAGLYAAFWLQDMAAAGSTTMDGAIETQTVGYLSGGGSWDSSTAIAVQTVTVSGGGMTQVISQPADVLLICNQLDLYYVDTTESMTTNSSGADGAESAPEDVNKGKADDPGDGAVGSPFSTAEYTITLTMHDGSTAAYYLAGNVLTDSSTGQKRTLSKEQLTILKTLLALPLS